MMQKHKESISLSGIYGLGTTWHFEFFEKIDKDQLSINIKTIIKEFENNYSRFIDTSLISYFNNHRNLTNPPLELVDLLQKGLELYNNSEGLFNIGIGQILEDSGYDNHYSFTSQVEKSFLPLLSKFLFVEINKISLVGPGKLDLGGYGKGYLIDKIASYFTQKLNLKYFLINGGGDIYVTSNNEEDIEIYLQSPQNLDHVFRAIKIKNSSLCASTIFKRRWKDKRTGQIKNHIINTNNDIKLVSTFVISSTAVIADSMATIMMLASNKSLLKKKLVDQYKFKYLCLDENENIIDECGFFD